MTKILEIKRGGGAKWGGLLQGTTGVGSIFKIANNSIIGTVGVQTIIDNTQTSAQIAQKIDLGTSAQGHTGILISMPNSSTLARGITIDPGTTGLGYGINFSGQGANGFRGINFGTIGGGAGGGIQHFGIYQDRINGGGSNSSTTGYGIYQNLIQDGAGAGTAYGIFQGTIGNGTSTTSAFGLYQGNIQGSNSLRTHYGIYQNVISAYTIANPLVSYGWYVANLHNNANNNTAKYFSLNGSISGILASRTTSISEILSSRISTRTSGTTTDNYDTIHFRQTSTQNGAGGTFVNSGSILKLENVAVQTAGTLTDTNVPLSLVQTSTISNGGHIRFNTYIPGNEAIIPNNTLRWTGTALKIKDNSGVVKTATLT